MDHLSHPVMPYCWISRDELISDVLQWTPLHGHAKTGRPAETYILQVCADTGCSPEDLPEAMDDREGWRERVRDIRVDSALFCATIWRDSILLLLFTPVVFFQSVLADGFSLEFSGSKSPQVSRTLFRILAILSNAVI